jgi:two-component system response regulator
VAAREQWSARGPSGRSGPILLVEDDADDEALVLRALESADVRCPILVARDADAACAELFGRDGAPPSALPSLVLLDLHLPGASGFDVLRRLRASSRTRLVPVIVFTGSEREEDVLEGYALGANSFLRKPEDGAKLAELVVGWARYWLQLNETPPA